MITVARRAMLNCTNDVLRCAVILVEITCVRFPGALVEAEHGDHERRRRRKAHPREPPERSGGQKTQNRGALLQFSSAGWDLGRNDHTDEVEQEAPRGDFGVSTKILHYLYAERR
jgi:hypothetical protein